MSWRTDLNDMLTSVDELLIKTLIGMTTKFIEKDLIVDDEGKGFKEYILDAINHR